MAINQSSIVIQGYNNQATKYECRVDDIIYNNGVVVVGVSHKRDGDSAYVDDGVIYLRVDGEIVDKITGVSPRDFWGSETLSAEAGYTSDISVGFETTSWTKDNGSVYNTEMAHTLDQVPPESELVEVSSGISRSGRSVTGFAMFRNNVVESPGVDIQATATLEIDGNVEDEKSFNLSPAEQGEYNFETGALQEGEKKVCIKVQE